MAMSETRSPYILTAREIAAQATEHAHPWNPNSQMSGVLLARTLGLKRCGVSIATIPPGKESFIDHAHWAEEEWLYILAGRGVARIGGETFAVAAGDFLAFPTPAPAHHLLNPHDEPLTYLMGGENRDTDIVDFPTIGRRLVRHGETMQVHALSDGQPLSFGPPAGDGDVSQGT